MLTFPDLNVDLFFSTPLTRGFFSTPPTRNFSNIDDDEFPKNGPIRIKARDRPPTWEPITQESRKDRRLKNRKGKRREA
jgi:hypothetical protein